MDTFVWSGRLEVTADTLFRIAEEFVRDAIIKADRVWGEPEDWRDFRVVWIEPKHWLSIVAVRERTFGEVSLADLLVKTAGNTAVLVEIHSDGFGQREIALALRDYLLTVLPTMQAESPAPTDASKAMKLTTGEWVALASLVFVILTCIAAWLVVPEVREAIPSFMRGAIPTLTPTLVSPTSPP